MTAPWDPMPSREWEQTRAELASTPIAWPEGLMRHDLRWWAARVRHGLAARIPSSRALAEEWGVGRKVARRVMSDEAAWMDPRYPNTEGPTTGPQRAHQRPTKGPADTVQQEITSDEGPTKGPEAAQEGPTKGHRRGVAPPPPQSTTTEDTLSNSGKPESDRRPLSATWEAMQEIRKRHQPGARGQAFSESRRRNLRARISELHKAGHDEGALLHTAAWVFTSTNMRAEGARKTGDPITTLLRPRNCLDYVELAIGEAAPATTAANAVHIDDPDAWVATNLSGLMEAWSRAEAENPANPHGPMGRMLRQRVTNHRDVGAAFWRARKAQRSTNGGAR